MDKVWTSWHRRPRRLTSSLPFPWRMILWLQFALLCLSLATMAMMRGCS